MCIGHARKWWNSSEYYIEEYFISPELQHQGFGTVFLQKIEEDLVQKSIKKITLLTARDTPAEKFYNKNGFVKSEYMIFLRKELQDNELRYADRS
ncbi:MAG: GNAT family N-acetyltransferase [Spirochaetales bacterium]|nr:GNAT family N-acetyltransferase [Spirochaetales bacterium]